VIEKKESNTRKGVIFFFRENDGMKAARDPEERQMTKSFASAA